MAFINPENNALEKPLKIFYKKSTRKHKPTWYSHFITKRKNSVFKPVTMASVFRYSSLKKMLGNLTKVMRDCFSFSPRYFWGSVASKVWLSCQTKHTVMHCRVSCIWLSFWPQMPRKKRKMVIEKTRSSYFFAECSQRQNFNCLSRWKGLLLLELVN